MLARQCEVDEHSEASWNGRVHTAMLDLSLYNDVYQGKVDFLNWYGKRATFSRVVDCF